MHPRLLLENVCNRCIMLSGACFVRFESNTDIKIADNAAQQGDIEVLVTSSEHSNSVSTCYQLLLFRFVLFCFVTLITALHAMQRRSSDENSVRPSVRLSNACIITKRKICPDFCTIDH